MWNIYAVILKFKQTKTFSMVASCVSKYSGLLTRLGGTANYSTLSPIQRALYPRPTI